MRRPHPPPAGRRAETHGCGAAARRAEGHDPRQECYRRRHMSRSAPLVFIMAAGLGTRMKSDLPKVLHRIAGRPLLHWVVTAARAAGAGRVIAILGHKADAVQTSLDAAFGPGAVEVVLQPEQRGTGHAVQVALPAVAAEADDRIVGILSGDAP